MPECSCEHVATGFCACNTDVAVAALEKEEDTAEPRQLHLVMRAACVTCCPYACKSLVLHR